MTNNISITGIYQSLDICIECIMGWVNLIKGKSEFNSLGPI